MDATVTIPRALGVAAATLVASAGVLAGFVDSSAAHAAPLTISTPAPGSFHTDPSVPFSGTKDLESSIHVTTPDATDPHCIIDPGTETWGCTILFVDGEHTVTVSEYAPAPAEEGEPGEGGEGGPIREGHEGNAPEALEDTTLIAESSVTIRVLTSPTLDGPLLSSGIVTGTGFPGAGIVVHYSGPETGEQSCPVVFGDGYWSCALPVAQSGDYSVSVEQSWPGAPGDRSLPSTAQQITIDRQAPPAPVITTPQAGDRISAQPTAYAGTGENGGRVEVFVNGRAVCSATVANGSWTCQGTDVPDGTRKVQAIQWDAAGNPSGASTGITVNYGKAQSPQQPDRGQAPPPAGPAPVDPPSQSPTPEPTTPTPRPSIPFLPPPIGGDSGLPPLQTWGTPTDYGQAIPTLQQSLSQGNWGSGALLALAFILLAALPLRLLLGTIPQRIRWRPQRLAGRNRADVSAEENSRPVLNPWLVGAGALAGAALIASLAGGLQAEVRYLRLVAAIGLGLVVLNLAGVVLSTKLTSRALGNETALRLVPSFLALATVSALISRSGGIQPPVIIGAVVAATFAAGMPGRERGIVALAQLASMTVLSVAAWLAHGWLGPVDGFWPSFWSESLAALCLAGLASVVLLVLPVSSLPGRAVFEWSKPVWFGTAFVAVTFAAVVIAGSEAFPLAWVLGGAFVFAAVSIATWSWLEFVEPRHPLVGTTRPSP